MKTTARIFTATILTVIWAAGVHVYLSQVRYNPEYGPGYSIILSDTHTNPADGRVKVNAEGFRKAVIEASRNIEPGIQPTGTSLVHTARANRTQAFSHMRIPVADCRFTRNPHGKIPLKIQTRKIVLFTSAHTREFFLIGLRHLII